MAKIVYLLVERKVNGEEKTFWNRAGVAFDPNKDGSVNLKLDLFPNLTFQIREKEGESG
jgi:hypothetical protein